MLLSILLSQELLSPSLFFNFNLKPHCPFFLLSSHYPTLPHFLALCAAICSSSRLWSSVGCVQSARPVWGLWRSGGPAGASSLLSHPLSSWQHPRPPGRLQWPADPGHSLFSFLFDQNGFLWTSMDPWSAANVFSFLQLELIPAFCTNTQYLEIFKRYAK